MSVGLSVAKLSTMQRAPSSPKSRRRRATLVEETTASQAASMDADTMELTSACASTVSDCCGSATAGASSRGGTLASRLSEHKPSTQQRAPSSPKTRTTRATTGSLVASRAVSSTTDA